MVVKVYKYDELRETFDLVREVCGQDVSDRFCANYYGTEQRLGQAFGNALAVSTDVRPEDYARLSGGNDPFWSDEPGPVWDALDMMTRHFPVRY